MLVVDLLHEFELGVWKTLFTQLIRLLYAAEKGSTLVTELNARFLHISFSVRQFVDILPPKVSPNTNIWLRYNSSVFSKLVGDEETRCARL